MRLVKPKVTIKSTMGLHTLGFLEECGRVCYKSEDKITDSSATTFIANIIKRGHESVLEHVSITMRFIVDRGVSHELVRHRIASFSQESTRYCNYGGTGIQFIIPPWADIQPGSISYSELDDLSPGPDTWTPEYLWLRAMAAAEIYYTQLIKSGWTPEKARSVLPNSLKTEVVMTTNLREWRHIFKLRTSKAAHPQMREVMVPLLWSLKQLIPGIFDDINV